ncbi:hypothetical protein QIS74_02918 [Colletotrichum tabaci]|uniref:Uncharacterized protein n=1 Tax=Colletotrichum tabaci TaxID=1209068 RepID=A0AAV9TPM8_9PEZI
MSNNTLVSQLAYGRDEPFPFVFLCGVITGIGIAHSAMFLIFTNILRNQMKRNIYKRESKLADLVTEFKQAIALAERLLDESNAFTIPFYDDKLNVKLIDLKKQIVAAVNHKDAAYNPIASPHDQLALASPQDFAQHAAECVAIINIARGTLAGLLNHGISDAQTQIAGYADRLDLRKNELDELKKKNHDGGDNDSELVAMSTCDDKGEEADDDDNKTAELVVSMDTRHENPDPQSFSDEEEVVVSESHGKKDDKLLL